MGPMTPLGAMDLRRCQEVGQKAFRKGDERLQGWYSPHRAIIALGVVLITVAMAGGTLGVINAGRAERATATLDDRYLVLQAPLRQLRSSVAQVQVLVEKSIGGATLTSAFITSATAETTTTDHEYQSLVSLIRSSGDSKLAPRLAAQMASYVTARSGLADFLGGAKPSPQTIHVLLTERTANTALDSGLGDVQAAVSTQLIETSDQARAAAADARDGLLLSMAIGVPFAVAITAILARKAKRIEDDSDQKEAVQSRVTRRNEFEAALQRALEMSQSEGSVFELVTEALVDAAPHHRAELLLADSSRAHFRQVLVSPADALETGCGVVCPDDCPAASRGQTMTFPLSTAIDACPHLRGRGCSALCAPVSISGNSVGVFHVTSAEGSAPSTEVRGDIEVVARRASERLAMLRAFELSQTKANSDSLTGLMTRRSVEQSVRDLKDNDMAYALAYGDLDKFKQLNDVFGHDAGDRALRTFSQVLRDSLRPSDIPCRYGGEEFVIVLPSCPVNEATQVLERVRKRLADRLTVGHLPEFTVSFGLASSDQAPDFQQVVSLADEALLLAKAGGRNKTVIAGKSPEVDSEEGATSVADLLPLGDLARESPVGGRLLPKVG